MLRPATEDAARPNGLPSTPEGALSCGLAPGCRFGCHTRSSDRKVAIRGRTCGGVVGALSIVEKRKASSPLRALRRVGGALSSSGQAAWVLTWTSCRLFGSTVDKAARVHSSPSQSNDSGCSPSILFSLFASLRGPGQIKLVG